MRKIIFIAALLTTFVLAKSQVSVKGKITDINKIPVAAGTVSLLHASDSTLLTVQVIQAEGNYEFIHIPAGNYILMVEMTGYQTAYKIVEIEVNKKIIDAVDFILVPQVKELKEVKVNGEKRLFENQTDRTILNVQNSPAVAGLNVLEVLGRSPNISIDHGSSQILMNGKQGIVVMLNGKAIRMESSALFQYLGGLSAASIKMAFMKRVRQF